MNPSPSFYIAVASDKGCRKGVNEDSYHADPYNGFFLISDGMGGHGAGDIASQIAVQSIVSEFNKTGSIQQALLFANRTILDASEAGEGTPQMGCTAVVLHIEPSGQYQLGWVGDSRAYLVSQEGLTLLTEDHSYVFKLMKEGLINEEEARAHPYRSVLLQSLGGGQDAAEPSSIQGQIDSKSVLLLCSDGLNSELEDQKISEIMRQHTSLQDAANALLQATLDNGAHDNVTLLLICLSDSNLVAGHTPNE